MGIEPTGSTSDVVGWARLATEEDYHVSTRTIQDYLTTARSTIHGEFVSTSRIVDTLLDLRQLGEATPGLPELIDKIMVSLPSHSVTPNEKWTASLKEIEQLIGRAGDEITTTS